MVYRDERVEDPAAFEKLGAFYLGRRYEPGAGVRPELLLYDSKDLTTHAVCVGMTGSGKTGLCLSLLEEAAIDGIPALAIDPKGDITNLMLGFPDLAPADFAPWVDPAEAARKGMTLEAFAADRAKLWRQGLADWGQDGRRIARLQAAADIAVFTPGSNAGLPLSLLRSFAPPPPELCDDVEAFAARINAAAAGLLGLMGIDADPIRSREQILLAKIFETAWRAGETLDLPGLIRAIQAPPFKQIGVMDLESVYPAADRMALSLRLNQLLAAPGFSTWLEGTPLDIPSLLWDSAGRPRIAILSIAHLNDAERMFFVTSLLNELLAWMRGQGGTSSLRALLYMDEVFGYLPPSANPPSKVPMLTLLKQARAFGVGLVLATQNPVDLDYKALSNAGTWFIGRLQTERDKQRLLDGLDGVAAASGTGFDRAMADRILSTLDARVFLMNNVHDDAPVLFHTRWALSYLRGPMARTEIAALMAARREAAAVEPAAAPVAATPAATPVPAADNERPVVPPALAECFLAADGSAGTLLYRPALLGEADLHYTDRKTKLDDWRRRAYLVDLNGNDMGADLWRDARPVDVDNGRLRDQPAAGARFAALPPEAGNAGRMKTWESAFKRHLYQSGGLALAVCPALDLVGEPGESDGAFRVRVREAAHAARDIAVEKLRQRYAPKLARLQDRIANAEGRLEREQAQYSSSKIETAVSIGTTVLGALFGRRIASAGNVRRAGSAARGVTRAARERGDVQRAQERLARLQDDLAALSQQFEDEVAAAREAVDPAQVAIDEITVAPRKSDIAVTRLALVWTPWAVDDDGIATPLFDA